MKNHPSALAAKVAATNAANAEVNRLAPLYRAIFAEYIGQKVTKADGSLLAKIQARLPSSPLQVYSPHVGCFVVKTHEQSNGIAYYVEPYFYAFTVNRQTGLCEALQWAFEPYRADYTPEAIQALRQKTAAAEKAFDDAKSELGTFGMYDR